MQTALIVDDSSTVRKMMTSIVSALGFETVQAKHGKEALETFKNTGGIAVVFVDWNMPVMNGLDLVKHLRAAKSPNDLKIVMVTTEVEMHRITAALDAGIDEYVMKPFTAAIIKEKMQMLNLLSE